jgi:outer membrane protein, heavy metal efflux system
MSVSRIFLTLLWVGLLQSSPVFAAPSFFVLDEPREPVAGFEGVALQAMIAFQAATSDTAIADTVLISTQNDLIRSILQSNQAIQSLRSSAEAQMVRERYVGAFPDPTLMVTGQPLPVYTARGKQVLGIRVEQMIPYPGKLALMRKMAVIEAEIGTDKVQSFAVEAILEGQLALNEINKFTALRAVNRRFQERLDGYEDLALRKYEVGEGNQQSVLKIQLERARLDQSNLEFLRVIEAKKLLIERLVQRPIKLESTGLSLDGAPRGDPGIDGPDQATLELESRSDLRALSRSLDLATSQKHLIEYYNRPDFGVSLNWIGIVKSDMPASSDGRDALAIGVSVKIPLGQSSYRSKKEESQLQIRAIGEQIESSKQSIEDLFTEVNSNTIFDRKSIDHINSSLLPSAEALIESSVFSYSSARGDFLDLLDAERTRFQLEMERIELFKRLGAGQLMLDRISGRLNRLISEQF